MDGNFVFCALVIIVNVKILISSYQYTWPAVTLIFLSIASFFIVYYVLCQLASYQVGGEFYHMFTSMTSYLTLLFFSFTFVLVDSGMQMANAEIIAYMLKQKELEQIEQAEESKQDRAVVRKKLTTYKCKCSSFLNVIQTLATLTLVRRAKTFWLLTVWQTEFRMRWHAKCLATNFLTLRFRRVAQTSNRLFNLLVSRQVQSAGRVPIRQLKMLTTLLSNQTAQIETNYLLLYY